MGTELPEKSQRDTFTEAARKLETDDDETLFKTLLKAIAKTRPKDNGKNG